MLLERNRAKFFSLVSDIIDRQHYGETMLGSDNFLSNITLEVDCDDAQDMEGVAYQGQLS